MCGFAHHFSRQHRTRTRTQRASKFSSLLLPCSELAIVSEREIVLQPLYLPPIPVVAVINPTGPFRLLSLRRQQTAVPTPTLSLRRQRVVVVVIKETTTTVPFLVVFPYPSFFSLSLARSSASHLLVVFCNLRAHSGHKTGVLVDLPH